MTQMSDYRLVSDDVSQANCATRWARSRLARPLHGDPAIRPLVFAMMFTGCVIPPSLSADTTDAGLNAAPGITSVKADNAELPEWNPVQFEQGVGSLNLIVYDTDLGDKLFPRVFVNYLYSDPKPARSECITAAGGTVSRTSSCDLGALCQAADVASNETLVMQVVVFDREPIPGVAPLFMALPQGGLQASRTFFLKCFPKQT